MLQACADDPISRFWSKPGSGCADTLGAMAKVSTSPLKSLLDAPRVRDAARELLAAVAEETARRALTPKASNF